MIDSQLEIEAGAVMSAGMQLRALRHSKSMDVAVLAGILKVPPQRILDLEADRFDLLPDLAFVRALATSICRVLKADAAPVLAVLPKGNAQVALEVLQSVSEQRASLRKTGSDSRADRQGRKSMILAVIILALAAVIWVWADGRIDLAGLSSSMSFSPSNGAPEQASSPGPASPDVGSAASASAGVTAPAQAVAVSASEGTAPTSGVSPDGRAQVTLSTTEPSWIEVRSSSSTVVYAGTLTAGQSMSLSVVEPASLIVGNARATQLLWRGQSVDLSPFTRDNVARLTWPQQP